MILSSIVQSIGLILDVVGVLIISNWLHNPTYRQNSYRGMVTNLPELLTKLNVPKKGTYFLLAGFIVQLIGIWI